MREITVNVHPDPEVLASLGLIPGQYDEMYPYLALSTYKGRFVIPTTRKAKQKDAFILHAELGFDYPGQGSENENLFGGF